MGRKQIQSHGQWQPRRRDPHPRHLGQPRPHLEGRRPRRTLTRHAPPPRPIDDRHAQIVALLYGPVALFAIEPGANTITQKQLLAAQRIGNSSAWEIATDAGKIRMLPYPDIKDETYRLYHQT
jgi:hypothetical protein